MRGRTPRWRWIVAGSGTLLAIAAVATAFTWSALFDYVLSRQVVLDPNSRSFPDWKAPSVPLFFDVYLFNWTNAERFPREPPMMQQLGPYRFREHRRHVDVTFHPHNGSVSYRTQRTWHFDHSGAGRLDDRVTTVNVLAAASVFRMRHSNIFMQKMIAFSLASYGHRISVSKLARELLFEGYEDGLLSLSKNMPSSFTGDAPKYDRFGWFYQRNNSMDTEGHLTVTTGARVGELPGQILMWNHRDHLPFYEGKCSEMVGSVGEFLPRNLTEDMQLTMFIGDLCRTVHLDFIHSGRLDGVTYLKYALTENSFDDSHTCFCNGECLWAGVMNVSACRYDSPIFLSLPHFLHGDARLHELAHGLEPDPDKHSFYFAVEPKMGVPLDVAGRFQVNVYLEPNPNIALFENVPRMLFPCFWVEQHVVVNQTITTNIRRARYVLDWGSTFCACCAIFFGALVVMVSFCAKRPIYSQPQEILTEKPKDEAEIKLNPIM